MKAKNIFTSARLMILAVACSGFIFSSCGGGQDASATDSGAASSQSSAYSSTDQSSSTDASTSDASTSEASADPATDMGVGPVTEAVEVAPAIDHAMAEKGKALFEAKCTACHNNTSEKKVGPGLKGVSTRRRPEWIMNMILNPSEMTQKDPIAKDLLGTYIAQMANQSLTKDEARLVYEYFRENDKNK